jgi:amidase
MVSLRFVCRLIAFLPQLVTIVAGQYSQPNSAFPSLLDATTDELAAGLQNGSFSSVDLVNVSFEQCCLGIALTLRRHISNGLRK